MRYKKILLGVIAGVLCLGILNGCSGYSHDFNSSEEAQKYILSKLKDKYNEEFIITEVKKYKEEKIGLNWIIAEVSSKENSSQTATVYTRNTGLFKDSYHVYYYSGCRKKVDGVYCGYNTYYGGNGISTQAPVFEYTYNGTYYREQTTQNISHKRLNKGMTQGKMYSIYIDPKHPAVFVLTKRIRIGTIVAIILGLFLFTGGIDFFLPMLSGR